MQENCVFLRKLNQEHTVLLDNSKSDYAFIYLSDIAMLAVYLFIWFFVFYSLENIDFV